MPPSLLPLRHLRSAALVLSPVLFATAMAGADAPVPAAQPSTAASGEQALVLSPFTVDVKRDTGYQATSTLAGTRLNSSLRDIAGQITVMTPEFMQDLGITDLNSALFYSLNTESDGE